MPLILGTNSIKDTGYDVDNSCRFAHNGDDKLDRTTETPTLGTKFTVSFWCKRDNLGDYHHILTTTANPGNWDSIRFSNGDKLQVLLNNETANYTTNRLFRDVSAWYHIVVRVDTTDATAGDRLKIYVNGVEETSFSTETHPAQNHTFNYQTSGKTLRIGANTWNTATGHEKLGGYLCEFCFIDGQALDADQFGEFDSDTGIWKPIDVSDLTFGDNGWYLDFEDSSSLGNDVSGNNNDFTSSGLTSVDQSTDTCTNNFATMNSIAFADAGDRLSEGNLRLDGTSSSAHSLGIGTIAVNQGKWWFEAELDAVGGTYPQIGLRSVDVNNTVASYVGEITGGVGYFSAGGSQIDGSTAVASGGYATYTSGDIINVGLDLDNNKIYWYKNGTLVNSGGTTITNRLYTFAVSQYSNTGHWFCNFGAGTIYSISSGNADENGFGNFEHAPPSGYFSLCTKNLAEFG